MQQSKNEPVLSQGNSEEVSAARDSRNLTRLLRNRILVLYMSGVVVLIGILFTLLTFEGMRMTRGHAEWNITAYASTGVALLPLAGTIIWRTLAAPTAIWEAAAQYAIGGATLAWAMLNHGFYDLHVMYSQVHLAVSAVFCTWNLAWVYRARTRRQ